MSGLTPTAGSVSSLLEELQELDEEYSQLEDLHKQYSAEVQKMVELQQKCLKGVNHQRYRTKQIQASLNKVRPLTFGDDKKELEDLQTRIDQRKAHFRELEENLPHDNGVYLGLILGRVSISILGKANKFAYKREYEQFKLVLSVIIAVFTVFALNVQWRVTDALFHFVLVWYYCTLTIRESILITNGSRIKGWWVAHHFISTFAAGIFVTWPESVTYTLFRTQLLIFTLYLGLVQILQYYYQSGCLYRLRALGERHDMDITVEGFQSWMWRGLTFLLPFLFVGYFFQLYNAYVLYQLSQHPQCGEWQLRILSLSFLVLFVGNTTTIMAVIRKKVIGGKKRQRMVSWATKFVREKYHTIVYETRFGSSRHTSGEPTGKPPMESSDVQ